MYKLWQTFPWVVPLGTTVPKVRPNLRNKILFTYTLINLIGLGGLCFPHLCTNSWNIISTQKPIICINILIHEPFLTHSWPNFWLFSFKCLYTYNYTLDIFSYLFYTWTIWEWSKLVIKITKDENSYHLCYWHQ